MTLFFDPFTGSTFVILVTEGPVDRDTDNVILWGDHTYMDLDVPYLEHKHIFGEN
jgi:hypothetical protein